MPVYQLESNNFVKMVEKMKEILQRLQQTTPSSTERPTMHLPLAHQQSTDSFVNYRRISTSGQNPDLSQTSLDSTGSSALDTKTNEINGRGKDDRISVHEHWTTGLQHRPISPAARSDPGVSTLLVRTVSDGIPGIGEEGDDFSDTSSRTSEDVTSRYSTERPRLERRHTETFSTGSGGCGPNLGIPHRRSTLPRSPMGGAPLYSNQASSPVSGTGSVRVKQRPNSSNSLRLKNRKIQPVTEAFACHRSTKKRVLKFVVAGDDETLSNMAKAFTHLRTKEPNLFWNLETQFHYIPLSQASSGQASANGGFVFSGSGLEPPEPANEIKSVELGSDVLIGRYVSHMDSWYEQNVMLATHNVLRLLPSDTTLSMRPLSSVESLDTRWSVPPTPSKILIDVASHYIREASHSIQVKVFKVKMTMRSEKSIKGFENKEVFMLHKIDIQRLTGKKAQRQAKPFETSLALTELSLDNSFIRGELTQHKDVWMISGSNIPHPTDTSVSNPENECLELCVMKCQGEGGRLSQTKYRVSDESVYHVYELLVEAKDKPLSVIVDGDVTDITENVIRIEVAPAYIDQGIVDSSLRRTERFERQLNFPLMTFWQVDL